MNYRRSDAASATYDSKIYVCGGFNGRECMKSVETYSPGDDYWCLVCTMTTPRSGVVVLIHQEKIWAIGGFDGNARLKSTEYYDGEAWNTGPSLIKERSNFAGRNIAPESQRTAFSVITGNVVWDHRDTHQFDLFRTPSILLLLTRPLSNPWEMDTRVIFRKVYMKKMFNIIALRPNILTRNFLTHFFKKKFFNTKFFNTNF